MVRRPNSRFKIRLMTLSERLGCSFFSSTERGKRRDTGGVPSGQIDETFTIGFAMRKVLFYWQVVRVFAMADEPRCSSFHLNCGERPVYPGE